MKTQLATCIATTPGSVAFFCIYRKACCCQSWSMSEQINKGLETRNLASEMNIANTLDSRVTNNGSLLKDNK